MFENRRFLIIPVSEIPNIDFNQVLESNAENLRKSVDGTKTFVKYEVNIIPETYTETFENPETGEIQSYTVQAGTYGRPSIFNNVFVEYNYQDMIQLLSTEEWTQSVDISN